MNIGFLIERNLFYKHFGPIIACALERGHKVFCLHDFGQPKGGSKAYQYPKIIDLPSIFQNKVEPIIGFNNENELRAKIQENNIQVIVSLLFADRWQEFVLKLKNDLGVHWVAIQHGFDFAYWSKWFAFPDLYFLYTPAWLDWMKRTQKEQPLSTGNARYLGYWEIEQARVVDKEKIKKEWGIPADKKVVLFMPFSFGSGLDRVWTRYVYGANPFFLMKFPFWQKLFLNFRRGSKLSIEDKKRFKEQIKNKENDLYVVGALREFCDKNNGFLLVKERKKDPAKNYLRKVADKIVADESFYPSTVAKCFAVADLAISFRSTATIEAAAFSVPHICVLPNENDWADLREPFSKTISQMPDFFDFPGVSYKLTIPQFLNKMPQANFLNFVLDKEQREKYYQKFIGDSFNHYSQKIMGEIESLVKK